MSEWETATLGSIANLTIGRTPPRGEAQWWTTDLERPFCTIADMGPMSVRPTREGVTEHAEQAGKAKRFPAGTLMMSFKLSIGKVGFAAVDVFPNEAIVGIDVHDPRVDVRYLAHFLGSQDLTRAAGEAVKGKTLNGTTLRAIVVSIPPMDVQRALVAAIDQMDQLRDALYAEAASLTCVKSRTIRDVLNRTLNVNGDASGRVL
ncbi:restriction endonuclease subunit S [Ornithinibacter aureus]|uniref:restriction endonuclease subunit S n=1 Tax=Ornithinibacter aureus TaxID=622664 RepID=UPI00135B6342|nr:restriction endonuclease subunit S [Ornithinibacter aureus]